MVSCRWPYSLVVHVQFWSSPDSVGHTGRLSKKKFSMCLRGLSVPFQSKHFDAFLVFSVVLGNSIHIIHILID